MRAKLENFQLKRDGAIAVQLLTKIKPMEMHGKERHLDGEEHLDKAVQLTFWEPNFVLHGVTLGALTVNHPWTAWCARMRIVSLAST